MKKTLILTLLVGCCTLLHAATYYCSPSGNASGTTMTTPCSFSNGVKKLSNPGDTLYLREGVYYMGKTTIQDKKGSPSAAIVISAYPGETAILDFRQTTYGTRGLQVANSCTYLHIRNLTLRYSGKNNLYNEGSYCTFENLDIYGSADTGCQMKNGGGNLIINVDSHDNFDYQHKNDNGEADFGGNADGFADKQHSGASNHYIGCRAWNNSDDGWDFFDRDNSSDSQSTIIEGCICYQNGPAEYDMRNHARYETDKAWFDDIDGQTIVNRYGQNQKVTLQHYPNHGNGNGFKLGGNYSTHNVMVHHCLSVANTVKGFDQNNDAGEMKIYNNTGYDNGNNMGFHNSGVGTLHIQNNISFQGRNTDLVRAQTIVVNDHNSWNNIKVNASDFQSIDTTEILRSRESNGSLQSGKLFRLNSNSSLVDAGINVGLSYYGAAPDLGWQEIEIGELHHGEIIDPTGNDTVQASSHKVAYVSVPGCIEDQLLLRYLRQQRDFSVYVTDANDDIVNYSDYELIIISPKPKSSAAGLVPLKGMAKPMLVLKPFLFKAGVWDWGTAVNTQDLSITVTEPEHPIFTGITITDGELQLFTECNTNAVTAISGWTAATATAIASPYSQSGNTAIAELEAGSQCNGTLLEKNLLMIGISEYSTTYLTEDALRLVSNSVRYLLQLPMDILCETADSESVTIQKRMTSSGLIILRNQQAFTITGQRVTL